MTAAMCDVCDGNGLIERLATPEEVDAGCELGIAYDPCWSCPQPWWVILTNAIDHGTWVVTCDRCGERVWFAPNTHEALDVAADAHRRRCWT